MTNDELLTKNMELAGVIRSLRANAREDAERIERLKRERDEARHKLELCMAANSDVARIAKERDEAREQNAKLREALLRVRTWGLASKNWSATHGDDMAQWIDAGCVGELPPPRSEWICGKLEGAK
jgi:hypothetical protein